MKVPNHFSVYVIELDPAVLKVKRFREANPEHDPSKPCVYVGKTGIDVGKRFEQHRTGYKSSSLVKRFGVRLRPRLYEKYNPMSHDDAVEMEEELARRLRKKGYAVWWN